MSNAAKHRKRAAEFELQKQFDKAIASYMRAIEVGDVDGAEVDVALLNKVGDLTLRLGRVAEAVESYERAIEHYTAVGLFNNAIALCNKILRHAPGRVGVYLTLGRVCARKGMRGDATRNFLEYASRMQQEGRTDEGMRALAEVAAALPELADVRRLVEEHAVRAGIALPAVVDVAVGAGADDTSRQSDALVFLDVDYESMVELTPAYGASAIDVSPAPPADRESLTRRGSSPRTRSIDDLLIFDPTAFEDDDAEFGSALDGLETTHPDADELAAIDTPSLLVSPEEPDSDEPVETPVGLTDALGFEPSDGAAHEDALEVLDGLVADDEAPLLPGVLHEPEAPVESAIEASEHELDRALSESELPGSELPGSERIEDLSPSEPLGDVLDESLALPDVDVALADVVQEVADDTRVVDEYHAAESVEQEIVQDVVWLDVDSSDLMSDVTFDDRLIELSVEGPDVTDEVGAAAELEAPSDELSFLTFDAFSGDVPAVLVDFDAIEAWGGDGEAGAELELLDLESLPGYTADDHSEPSTPLSAPATAAHQRLNPHDFILPGELPPIVYPDDRLASAAAELTGPEAGAGVELDAYAPGATLDELDLELCAAHDDESDGHADTGLDAPIANAEAEAPVADTDLDAPIANAEAEAPVADTDLDALVDDRDIQASIGNADPTPPHTLTPIVGEISPDDATHDAPNDATHDALNDATHDAPHDVLQTPPNASAALEYLVADDEASATIDNDPTFDPDDADDLDAVDELEAILTPRTPALSMNLALDRCARLREEVESHPGDWARRRRLAEAYLEAGELETGLAELAATVLALEVEGDLKEAARVTDELVRVAPDVVAHHLKRVELAVRLGDRDRLRNSYLDLADAMVRIGQATRAESVYVRVLELDPWDDRARAALGAAAPPPPAPKPVAPTADDGYVNLADWLSDDSGTRDTRMRVKEPTATGDEDADFTRLLQHFREGVSRSLGDEDYESHYDLGVAYKEMGLLDDAIAEFQRALRSPTHRLPAYEALGQCFLEQGSFPVAVTVLSRALHEPGLDDEQRVGVLYLLGYACEALQRRDEARSYFQRVYATDIYFRDVAERLAALDGSAG